MELLITGVSSWQQILGTSLCICIMLGPFFLAIVALMMMLIGALCQDGILHHNLK